MFSRVEGLVGVSQDIFIAGVRAADPYRAVILALDKHESDWADALKVHIVAAGKAAPLMCEAAVKRLPATMVANALAVTNYENVREVEGVTVIGASHPLPDEAGVIAAQEVLRIANGAGPRDLVLCLVSGGASALLPAPVEGVSLAEKMVVHDLLLRSGADIVSINLVRRALSVIKGGGLARAIAPARGLALIFSDVPGDDLSVVASGPTVPDPTPMNEALVIVRSLGLEERMPTRVLEYLTKRAYEAKLEFVQTTTNVLVGSNSISLKAMVDAARQKGFSPTVLTNWLGGDVREAARAFHDAGFSAAKGKIAILSGGETTVVVNGSGKGGRNQELALRFAELNELNPLQRNWVFLSGGTDGRDGPTEAAGGLVSAATVPALIGGGHSLADSLANNDAFHALQAANSLLFTGPTGTNVADLQVLLLE